MGEKMFDLSNLLDRIENRKRLKASRDLIVNLNGEFKKAKLIPEEEFQKEYYKNNVYYHYGNEYIIFVDWEYSKERVKYLTQLLLDDCVYYARLYPDKDGVIIQTPFKKM